MSIVRLMAEDNAGPRFERIIRVEMAVPAPADRVYAAIHTANLDDARLLRPFRTDNGLMETWKDELARFDRPPFRLLDLRRFGFVLIRDTKDVGVTLGAVARLWSVRPSLTRTTPESFPYLDVPGFTKLTLSLFAQATAETEMNLIGEIRFVPLGKSGRTRFRTGWPIGRTVARFALKEMMTLIRRKAIRDSADQ